MLRVMVTGGSGFIGTNLIERFRSQGHHVVNVDAGPPRNSAHASLCSSVEDLLTQAFPGQRFAGQVHLVEHHLARLASAFLVSPFDEASAVSVDCFSEFASAAWGLRRGSTVGVEAEVFFPLFLGVFYQALTQCLEFPLGRHLSRTYPLCWRNSRHSFPLDTVADPWISS